MKRGKRILALLCALVLLFTNSGMTQLVAAEAAEGSTAVVQPAEGQTVPAAGTSAAPANGNTAAPAAGKTDGKTDGKTEVKTDVPDGNNTGAPVVNSTEGGAPAGGTEVKTEGNTEVKTEVKTEGTTVVTDENKKTDGTQDESAGTQDVPGTGETDGVVTDPQTTQEIKTDVVPEQKTQTAVKVVFVCEPAEAVVTVAEAEGKTVGAASDGSWMLMPGKYTYSASCEGYVSQTGCALEIPADCTGKTVSVKLEAAELEEQPEEPEQPEPEEVIYNEKPIRASRAADSAEVRIEAPAGSFPEGTEAVVTVIEAGYGYHEYDISFLFKGEKIQPAKPVVVTMTVGADSSLLQTNGVECNLVVYHIPDDPSAPEELVARVPATGAPVVVTFQASHFSHYAIVPEPVDPMGGIATLAEEPGSTYLESNLNTLLNSFSISGVTAGADGKYEITKDRLYSVNMSFSEQLGGAQFDNQVVYTFPNGFTPKTLMGKTNGDFDSYIRYEGVTYAIPASYAVAGDKLTINFRPEDATSSEAREAWALAEDVDLSFKISGIFNGDSADLNWGNNINTQVTLHEPGSDDVTPGLVNFQKEAMPYSFNSVDHTIKYKIKLESVNGDSHDVEIKDTLTGNGLREITNVLPQWSDGNPRTIEGATYTIDGKTLTYRIPELSGYMELVVTVRLDLDQFDDGSADEVTNLTGNSVTVHSKEEPGDQTKEASYNNEIGIYSLAKTVTGQDLENGNLVADGTTKTLEWKITLNDNALVPLKNDKVKDSITSGAQYMKYSGDGITIKKMDRDGNVLDTVTVPWTDMNVDTSSATGWEYTINDNVPYRYEITYTTELDTTDLMLNAAQIKNSVTDDHGSEEKTVTTQVSEDNKQAISKIGKFTPAPDGTAKNGTIEWTVNLEIPGAGLPMARIYEYLPIRYGAVQYHDPVTSVEFIGLEEETPIFASGIQKNFTSVTTTSTFSDEVVSSDCTFTIGFQYEGENGQIVDGLKPSSTGKLRHITMKVTQRTDDIWWNNQGLEDLRWNKAVLGTQEALAGVSARVLKSSVNKSGNVENYKRDDLPVYKYTITLVDVNDSCVTDDGLVVFTDTFDTSILQLDTMTVSGEWDYTQVNNIWGGAADNIYEMSLMADKDKGELTVEVTDTGLRVSVPASNLMVNGAFHKYYKFTYKLVVKDADALQKLKDRAFEAGANQNFTTQISNTVTFDGNSDSANVGFTYEAGVQKYGEKYGDDDLTYVYHISVRNNRGDLVVEDDYDSRFAFKQDATGDSSHVPFVVYGGSKYYSTERRTDDDAGKLTVQVDDANSKATFTMSEENLPKKDNGELYEYYTFCYVMEPKDAATREQIVADALQNGSETFNNTASFAGLTATNGQVYSYDNSHLVGKQLVGEPNTNIQQIMADYVKNGNTGPSRPYADFQITVNSEKLNVDPNSETVRVIDSFNMAGLSVDYSSIQVVCAPADHADLVSYSFRPDPEKLGYSQIVFDVPDGACVTITYRAWLLGVKDDNDRIQYNLDNTAWLDGKEGSSSTVNQNLEVDAGISSMGSVTSIRIMKAQQGNANVKLAGAQFAIYKGMGTGMPLVDKNGKQLIVVTDETGIAVIKGIPARGITIEPDTYYTAKEIVAPDGYEINNTLFYFMINKDAPNYSQYIYLSDDILTVYDEALPVGYTPGVEKRLTGDPYDGSATFTFRIDPVAKADVPAGIAIPEDYETPAALSKNTVDVTIADGNSGAEFFDRIEYSKPGVYVYQITEQAGQIDGMAYSQEVSYLVVTVHANSIGALVAPADGVYYRNGTAAGSDIPVFTNTYTRQEIEFTPEITKAIVGDNVPNETFTFVLKDADGQDTLGGDKTVSVTGAGEATFDAITYNKGGTYEYTITEQKPTNPTKGMDYSEQEINLVVTVSEDLKTVTAKYDGQTSATITNYYGLVEVNGTKTWADGNDADKKRPASITVKLQSKLPDSENWQDVQGVENKTVEVDANGDWKYSFTNLPKYSGSAEIQYRIVEVNVPDGYTASTSGYDITNTHIVSTKAKIEAKKELEGRSLKENEFSFILTPVDNAPMVNNAASETKQNAANGVITFSEITFTEAGTYKYTISEVVPDNKLPGVTYDTTTVINVEVKVEVTAGALKATVTYNGNETAPAFKNSYVPGSTTAEIHLGKTLTGRAMDEKEFTFQLVRSGETEACATVQNGAANVGVTSEMTLTIPDTFTTAGTYEYVLSEVQGKLPGVTYSTKTFAVVVTVADVNGQLTATVTYDGMAEVPVFENSYTPGSTTAKIEAKKDLEGRDLKAGEFSFILQPVGNAPMANNAASETKQNAANGEITFSEITFTEAGTYKYTIKEVVPDAKLPGVTYTDKEVNVTVEVKEVDGALNATVTYDNSETVLTFTNTYTEQKVEFIPQITKAIVGENVPSETFTFVLKEADGQNTLGGEKTATVSGNGTATFETITYNKGGTYNYTITEKKPTNPTKGMDYSEQEIKLVVTVSNDLKTVTAQYDGQDSATVTNYYGLVEVKGTKTWADGNDADKKRPASITVKLQSKTGSEDWQDVENKTVTQENNWNYSFTNLPKYSGSTVIQYRIVEVDVPAGYEVSYNGNDITNTHIVSTKATFEAKKVLEGRDLKAGEFSFILKPVDNAPMANNDASETKQNAANGEITFSEITFTEAGTYKYTIKEVVPDAKLPGVTYTDKEVNVTVEVKAENGALNATVTYDNSETVPTFTNTYKTGETTAEIKLGKKLTGRAMAAGEFEFQLTAKGNTEVIASVKNGAAADGATNEMTLAIPGSYKTAGTYEYELSEVKGELGGVTYDGTKVAVKVVVTDDGAGHLSAAVSYGANNSPNRPVFANTYQAKPVEFTVQATKILVGRELQKDEFNFVLLQGENVVRTAANDEDGKVTFTPVKIDVPCELTYTLAESKGTEAHISYDDTLVTVKVSVTDPGNGQLVANVTYNEKSDIPEFTNTYTPDPTTATVSANKILTGRDLKAGEFTFRLSPVGDMPMANDAVYEDKQNAADGTVTFSTITYGKAGVYNYLITEVVPADANKVPGVTYDATTQISVKVTVTDVKGKLNAVVTYGADDSTTPKSITNTYAPEKTSAAFTATKQLRNKQLTAGSFSFQLKQGSTVLQTKTNAANGAITFDAIEYTEAGTYQYTISEVRGDVAGILYDTKTVRVNVEVTDDGNGQLVATVTYDGAATAPTFTNTYLSVKISKVDFADGEPLSGAVFVILDESGEAVKRVIVGSTPEEITGLQPNVTYTLREVTAPKGYATAPDITFTIDRDGIVTTTAERDSSGAIVVEDKITSITIRKVDASTNKSLENAKLQVLDLDGNVVDEWISEKGSGHVLLGLETGVVYTLHEVKAPKDYVLAKDIQFTILADGTISTKGTIDSEGRLVMKDAKKSTSTTTGVEDYWPVYMGGSAAMLVVSGWMIWLLRRKEEQDARR